MSKLNYCEKTIRSFKLSHFPQPTQFLHNHNPTQPKKNKQKKTITHSSISCT